MLVDVADEKENFLDDRDSVGGGRVGRDSDGILAALGRVMVLPHEAIEHARYWGQQYGTVGYQEVEK